jgi:hypothetical protein
LAESAADRYAALVRAAEEHQRTTATRPPDSEAQPDRWRAGAARFREDPFREHDTLTALLAFIEPADTVLDVGGGAGRYLPIALHCQAYVNVEPSPGMGAQFEASVRDAGIANARWLHSDWLGAEIEGDICFSANVVYYIADIVPFVAKLTAASRRRVMIVMHSVPPRNVGVELYRYIYGHDRPLDPGYQELLPVLWEMGLLPDVRVLGPSDFIAEREQYANPDSAIAAVLPKHFDPEPLARARRTLEDHFDELFVPAPEGGYRRRPNGSSRVLLLTWESNRA